MPDLTANNKPQNWKLAKYLILWSTLDNTIYYLNYNHSKTNTTTYCNRDDVEGFIHNSWDEIKNKIATLSLSMTENVQRIYDDVESGLLTSGPK